MELKIYDSKENGRVIGIGDGHLTAEKLTSQIDASKGQDIKVRINSGGGSVFDGWAAYNALHSKKEKVTTIAEGIAASISGVILQGGFKDKSRGMYRNSLMMVHLPKSGVQGTAEEMKSGAVALELIENQIIDMFTENTGLPRNVVAEMLQKETYLNAQMAKDLGFIDFIIDGEAKLGFVNRIEINAPIEYQHFVNSIYTENTNNSEMDKNEIIEANTGVLTKLTNWLEKTFSNQAENKKKQMYCKADMIEGAEAFSDADFTNMAEDDDYEFEDSIVNVKGGKVASVTKKTVTPTNQIDLTETVNKLTTDNSELVNQIAESKTLITEMKNQLELAQAELKKTDEEIRASIKSEFEPKNSQRSMKTKDGDVVVGSPKMTDTMKLIVEHSK